MACNTLQTTTVANPTLTDSLLKFFNSQFFPKKFTPWHLLKVKLLLFTCNSAPPIPRNACTCHRHNHGLLLGIEPQRRNKNEWRSNHWRLKRNTLLQCLYTIYEVFTCVYHPICFASTRSHWEKRYCWVYGRQLVHKIPQSSFCTGNHISEAGQNNKESGSVWTHWWWRRTG